MRRGWVVLGLTAGTLLLTPWTPAWAEPSGASGGAAGKGELRCRIDDPRITESSGLAAAGDRLYTVNDGGSRLQVFVLDTSAVGGGSAPVCRVVRTISAAIDPYDVEDLARSADGTLWLADLGDNDHSRRTVAIELLSESGAGRLFRFSYPDGPHDAEALLLDRSGRPFIVTKQPLGNSGVYTPAGTPSTSRPTPLRRVAGLQLTPTGTPGGPVGTVGQLLVTGGAVSPDGTRIVLRTYTDAYVWRAEDGDVAGALATGRPVRFPLPPTAQGEAVTFTPDGRNLLTSTEGRPAAVHVLPLGEMAAPAAGRPTDRSAGPARSGGPARPGGPDDPAGKEHGYDVFGKLALAFGLAAAVVWGGGKAASMARR
jgi:hypothetical protein